MRDAAQFPHPTTTLPHPLPNRFSPVAHGSDGADAGDDDGVAQGDGIHR